MEENKNMTPGDNIPEEDNSSENVVAPGEITQEELSVEEITEEAFISEEGSDVEEIDEPNVAESEIPLEETSFPAPKKKSRAGLIVGIALAAVAFIIAVIFLGKGLFSSNEGSGNLYTQGFATVSGKYMYNVNFSDLKMYKTNLKTMESTPVTEDNAVYISKHKNDIYYMGYLPSEDGTTYNYSYKKYVDGINDVVILNEEITSPQLVGNYVYYLKSVPEFNSGYSSQVYRAELKANSTPELVCDVLCISFYVKGNTLYYCDVQTGFLTKVNIPASMKYISENPLAENSIRSSEELGADTVVETIAAFISIRGNTMYYVDLQNDYTLSSYNLRTGEVKAIGGSVKGTAINIYGDFLFYYGAQDFCLYRMNLDGSNITKVSDVTYGLYVVSEDKLLYVEYDQNDNFNAYINVCNLDGEIISTIKASDNEAEEYYDDIAEGVETEDSAVETELDLTE